MTGGAPDSWQQQMACTVSAVSSCLVLSGPGNAGTRGCSPCLQEFGELLGLGPLHVRMLAAELMQPPAARLRSAFGSSGPVVQLHTALVDLVGLWQQASGPSAHVAACFLQMPFFESACHGVELL